MPDPAADPWAAVSAFAAWLDEQVLKGNVAAPTARQIDQRLSAVLRDANAFLDAVLKANAELSAAVDSLLAARAATH